MGRFEIQYYLKSQFRIDGYFLEEPSSQFYLEEESIDEAVEVLFQSSTHVLE